MWGGGSLQMITKYCVGGREGVWPNIWQYCEGVVYQMIRVYHEGSVCVGGVGVVWGE